jgi:hypothetical protein
VAAENVRVCALEGCVDVDGGVGEHVGRDGRVQQADSDGRTSSLLNVLNIKLYIE